MKLLDTTQTKVANYYSRARRAIIISRKFSVNVDKNAYKCWVCDYHGRSIRRLIRRFGSYIQLQKWDRISDRTDLERFDELFMEGVSGEGKATVQLPEEFISLCSDKIPATGMYAYRYLHSRGITKADILKWKIGYCFSGEYRNRVVIPSFDDDGDCSYFIARSYTGDSYKYKNPRSSKISSLMSYLLIGMKTSL